VLRYVADWAKNNDAALFDGWSDPYQLAAAAFLPMIADIIEAVRSPRKPMPPSACESYGEILRPVSQLTDGSVADARQQGPRTPFGIEGFGFPGYP
jgi:hypothetical protein